MIEDNTECKKARPEKEYTHLMEFINNMSYIVMTLLGASVLILGTRANTLGWILAGSYVLYGITGVFWIIIFVCPYCHFIDTTSCPCGYGQISAKICKVQDQSRFTEKFKKNIPVIIPLWIIPLVAGIIFLAKNFTFLLLAFVVLFFIDAFLVLPLLSRKYGCAHCPQKNICPWMSKEEKLDT